MGTGADTYIRVPSGSDGQVLIADSGETAGMRWGAASGGASNLDDLGDVVITTPGSGQYIRHNGTNFVNGTIQAGDLPAHASRHQSGGADAIKLDDLAAPDDNTDLNASTSAHGLLKKLDGNAAHYMDGSGNWSTPAGGGGGVDIKQLWLNT